MAVAAREAEECLTEPSTGFEIIVHGNRDMVTQAIRTVAAESRFEGGRYSLEESVDSDYGPSLVIRANTGTSNGFLGKIILQEAPRGLVVKIPPYKSEFDPDGKLFGQFKMELIREFGRRGIMP